MLTRRRGEGRNNLEFGLFSRPMTEITIGTNLSKMFKASEHLKGSHLRLCALLHEHIICLVVQNLELYDSGYLNRCCADP